MNHINEITKLEETSYKGGISLGYKRQLKDIDTSSYGLIENDETLITYGIDTCYAIAIINEDNLFLSHLYSKTPLEDLQNILEQITKEKSKVFLVLGPSSSFKDEITKRYLEYFENKKALFRKISLKDSGSMILDKETLTVYEGLGNIVLEENIEKGRRLWK